MSKRKNQLRKALYGKAAPPKKLSKSELALLSGAYVGFDLSQAPDFTAISVLQAENTQPESTTRRPTFDWNAVDYSAIETRLLPENFNTTHFESEYLNPPNRVDFTARAERARPIITESTLQISRGETYREATPSAYERDDAVYFMGMPINVSENAPEDRAIFIQMREVVEQLGTQTNLTAEEMGRAADQIRQSSAYDRFQEIYDGMSLFASEYDQEEESEMPYVNSQYLHRALGELLVRSAVVNSNIEVNRNLQARAYDIHIRVREEDLQFRELDVSPSFYEANTEYVIYELVRNLEQTRLSEHGRLRKLLEAINNWIKEANTTESWDRLRKEIELAETMLAFNPLKGQTFEQSIATPHEDATVKAGRRRIKLGKKSKDGA